MNYKILISSVLMYFAFAKAVQATTLQDYKQHTVVQGETLFNIVQKYNITAKELLDLNPDLKSGLKAGSVLIIPADAQLLTQAKIVDYKKHRVRRKETLYSISRKYDVTILDIKDANKELYSKELRKGQRIKIPIFEKIDKNEDTVVPDDPIVAPLADNQYRVQARDNKYRIAKKFKTTITQLENANNGLKTLQPGQVIIIPQSLEIIDIPAVTSSIDSLSNMQFIDYEVPPKMTMYSLTKLVGISKDSLIALNPSLKDGLKNGSKIRIPNPEQRAGSNFALDKTYGAARLVDSIRFYKQQRIAVMLPFSLNKLDTAVEDRLKKDATLRIALDFYSGMVVARDSATALGIPVEYALMDTQKSLSHTQDLLNSTNFNQYLSVIGPLLSKNVVAVAKELKRDNIPVISPLTNSDVRLYSNLFQARPDEDLLKQKLMAHVVKEAVGKNVIIVTDNKKPELKEEWTRLLPDATVLVPNAKKNYIFMQNYIKPLVLDQDNIVILAVDNVGFITDAVSHYSSRADTHKIFMYAYENYVNMDLPNNRLAQLHFTYPKINSDKDENDSFKRNYNSKYGIPPNSYATRGFDVAMDVILRQASAGDLYESSMINGRTSMVENRFDYSKKFMAGYYNQAVYLLQYQEDLSIKELN